MNLCASASPRETLPRITVADLMELVDYTPLASGEVRATLNAALGHTIEHIAEDQGTAETVMRAACHRIARHLNEQ